MPTGRVSVAGPRVKGEQVHTQSSGGLWAGVEFAGTLRWELECLYQSSSAG